MPSLADQRGGATLADGKLTLTGVRQLIVFADRPVRGRHMRPRSSSAVGRGRGQFAIDPPNATVSVIGAAAAIATPSSPYGASLDGDTLTFDVVVLEGSLDGATGRPRSSSTVRRRHHGGGSKAATATSAT